MIQRGPQAIWRTSSSATPRVRSRYSRSGPHQDHRDLRSGEIMVPLRWAKLCHLWMHCPAMEVSSGMPSPAFSPMLALTFWVASRQAEKRLSTSRSAFSRMALRICLTASLRWTDCVRELARSK